MSGDKSDKAETKFAITSEPFSHILHLINDGRAKEISFAALANEIREHGFVTMPGPVVAYLVDLLEGRIERRGRKAKSRTENVLKARYAAFLYDEVTKAIKGQENALPEFVDLVEKETPKFPSRTPDSEASWRIVSMFFKGEVGHYKKLCVIRGFGTDLSID